MPGHCQLMPLHITQSRCCSRLVGKWRHTEYFPALGSKDTARCAGWGWSFSGRTCRPPPVVWASAVAHMGRRCSSTLHPLTLWNQWIFSSATSASSFQSPSLAPFLLFPPHPGTEQTLCDEPTAEWGGHTGTLPGLGSPCPCKQDCAVPKHPTKGWLQPPVPSRAPVYLTSQLTHNEFTSTGIYSLYWEAGTAIGIQNIPQTQGEAVGYFCFLPYMTVPQYSKGSFTNINPSGCISLSKLFILNNIREQTTPLPLKVWSLAASFKTQKMGNYFGFCRLWIANPND